MAIGNLKIENYVPVVKLNKGIKTALPISSTSSLTANTVTATTLSVSSTTAITGALTPTGGIAAAGGFSVPTVYHSGGIGVVATTGLNQKQIVTTETYYAEVFVPANTTITGVAILNGHTTSASQNMNVGLANSSGTIVANSATTTAQATADTYQQIPFTTPYAAKGPAKYFIAVQGSQTTGFIATFGTTNTQNFGAAKVTSETYGTFLTTASYATTTYTGNVAPVADLY